MDQQKVSLLNFGKIIFWLWPTTKSFAFLFQKHRMSREFCWPFDCVFVWGCILKVQILFHHKRKQDNVCTSWKNVVCSMMNLILAPGISQVTISSFYFLTQNFALETQDLILKARFYSRKFILRIKSQVLRIKWEWLSIFFLKCSQGLISFYPTWSSSFQKVNQCNLCLARKHKDIFLTIKSN